MSNTSSEPVSEGVFCTGDELMLWRPGIDRAYLRRRAARATLRSAPAGYTVLGVAGVSIAAQAGTTPGALVLVVSGTLVAVLNVVRVAIAFQCAETDHRHAPSRSCLLDRVPGEFFYRPSDFIGLTPTAKLSAYRIIESVRLVHASRAAVWLDRRDLNEIHWVAWNVLYVLHQSRPLRAVLHRAADDAIPATLVDAARRRQSTVDAAVDEVVGCLDKAVVLVRAWEQKLDDFEVQLTLRSTLDRCPDVTASVERAVESIPENVFAYVTAARDVTCAGRFPWETGAPNA